MPLFSRKTKEALILESVFLTRQGLLEQSTFNFCHFFAKSWLISTFDSQGCCVLLVEKIIENSMNLVVMSGETFNFWRYIYKSSLLDNNFILPT
jgi:hypothetical protein